MTAPPSTTAKRSTVFLFCYRFFDIRLLVSAGVIRALAEHSRVVLFAPKDVLPVLAAFFGDMVLLEPINYSTDDFEGRNAASTSWKKRVLAYLTLILGFVYGNQRRKPNMSADLHIRSYLARAASRSRAARLRARVAVAIAQVASASYPVRRALQALYAYCGDNRAHAAQYATYKPELAVTTTFGLSIDGLILVEARTQGVPTCAIVQSWDKTSTKGYPAIRPDFAVLWSQVTAVEASAFLDMDPARVFVEGAPLWDAYFRARPLPSREEFFARYHLDARQGLIFFSVGSPCYHKGNKAAIELLISHKRAGKFSRPVNILFRAHPGYLFYAQERADWDAFLKQWENEPGVVFTTPESVAEGNGYHLVEEEDFDALASTFTHCDVSVSIVSSHLIESAIFDKPAINIEYGRWTNDMYDFDLSCYTAEHLYRIYRTGAVYRAFNPDELLSAIDDALANPTRFAEARRRLVDQEMPVNRGCAGARTAQRLAWLATRGHVA